MIWEWFIKIWNWLKIRLGMTKQEVEYGIPISIDDVYRLHHMIYKDFKYLYVDLNGVDETKRKDFIRKFGSTYRLIVYDSSLRGYFDSKGPDFRKAMDAIKYTVQSYKDMLYGYAVLLSEAPRSNRPVFESVLLARIKNWMYRDKINLYLVNAEQVNTGALSYAYTVERRYHEDKFVKVGLDFTAATEAGIKYMENKEAARGLAKDTGLLILSGIDSKDKNPSILKCKRYKLYDYQQLIKVFRRSPVILRGDVMELVQLKRRVDHGLS